LSVRGGVWHQGAPDFTALDWEEKKKSGGMSIRCHKEEGHKGKGEGYVRNILERERREKKRFTSLTKVI